MQMTRTRSPSPGLKLSKQKAGKPSATIYNKYADDRMIGRVVGRPYMAVHAY